jgi:hypothetical protein
MIAQRIERLSLSGRGPKSFVSRILTSKFFEKRILQGISCESEDSKD